MTIYKALRIPSWISDPVWRERLDRWLTALITGFHRYANWLVRLSWWRFLAYALIFIIGVRIVTELPPFTWRFTEYVENHGPSLPPPPEMPEMPEKPELAEPEEAAEPAEVPEAPEDEASAAKPFEIKIGRDGVRIGPRGQSQQAAQVDISAQGLRIVAPGDPAASGAASGPQTILDIRLPKEATEEIRREMEQAAREAHDKAKQAAERQYEREKRNWEREKRNVLEAWRKASRESGKRTRVIQFGDFLMDLAVIWVLASALLKGTYKGRIEAETKAAAAEETAEAEALKRQLVEARLNTMQAQVEPHFLFNTLASIDHLIEVDPKRASQMQKNLIALLRATMPTMREAAGTGNGLRDLKREMAVVRPYLEILQVRMEERLQVELDVPDGLLSAEFPPMIIQGLVENAIKHGLEPKPEGGSLAVRARIEHGKLVVEVADTGLGFGRAATAGTGVGLANTRERLQLLYGNKGSLTVAENQPCGTLIRISVPYKSNEGEAS